MPNTYAFRPREDQEEAMKMLIEQKGSQTDALRFLIDYYLKKGTEETALDICPSLVWLDDSWKCVKGRIGKTPDIKKLGTILDQVKLACAACTRDRGLLQENIELRKQLEKGTVIQVPSCTQGGRLSEDGKKLWCIRTKQYENVQTWCKIIRNGANCEHLRWTQLEVKGKLPNPDNR